MATRTVPTYWDYLRLDDLLRLQGGLEGDDARLMPDELHFIIVHQAFELWFKLILRELRLARDHLAAPRVPEETVPLVVHHLRRVNVILEHVVDQFRVMETLTPLVMTRREIRTDSGGAGRFRGGVGQVVGIRCRSGAPWSMSSLCDRTRFPARGMRGGRDGACGSIAVSSGEPARPREQMLLPPDAEVTLSLPGGGGYGDPRERDPERVRTDVEAGYVSPTAAASEYGAECGSMHAVLSPERSAPSPISRSKSRT